MEKQKLNTGSCTIAELEAVHQFSPKVPWTPSFLKEQGHNTEENVTLQDNKSAISLEENGKRSSGKRTWAVNMHCFMTTDQIGKGNIKILHCAMDDMVGGFVTKGLKGLKFRKFKNNGFLRER